MVMQRIKNGAAWDAVRRIVNGNFADPDLMKVQRGENGRPGLSGPSAEAVGSTSGGPRNGMPPSAMKKGKFSSASFVDPNETLQAAIDKAPASSTLVQRVSAGITNHGGGVYSIALAAPPDNVYVDADYLMPMTQGFDGTALRDPDARLTNNVRICKYDTGTGRLLMYNKGAAVTAVDLVKYHAVVATTKNSYDAIILRPGIMVVGMGRGVSEIRPTSGRNYDNNEYSVLAAAYSGLIDIDVVRPKSILYPDTVSDRDCNGLVFPAAVTCDQFYFEGGRIYTEPGLIVDPGAYGVPILFGCQGANRAKNVNFVRALVESRSTSYVWETGSGTFIGRVIFTDSVVHGDPYIDGAANTFYLINTPWTNLNSPEPNQAMQFSGGKNFSFNLGGAAPFSAEDVYEYIAINSPHYVGPRNDATLTASLLAMDAAGSSKRLFRNSPITGCDQIVKNTGAQVLANPLTADRWESEGYQPVPIKLTSTYSDTVPTPKWSKIIADTARNSTTAAAGLNFGIIQIKYEDLVKRKTCRARVRGKFAANANSKTLKVQAGVNAAINPAMALTDVSGGTFTGTYNGLSFEYKCEISLMGTTVLVSGSMVIGGTATPFMFISETAIAAGQYFKVVLNATAVTTAADVVISFQQVEVDG